ncbi:LamG domain-containing protein [Phycisphaeraceae bacterium D3-23]
MRADTHSPAYRTPGLETLEPRLLLCASSAITADLTTELNAWWRFDEPGVATVADESGSASTHSGTLNGAAGVSALGLCGGAGVFAGGEMNVANHNDINLDTNAKRTIALWFNADDLDAPGRQMLYEEGGGTRGLNIYLDAGQLVVGGWNRAESGWQGTWLSTQAVWAGQWHHVVLTLDGTATTQPDALRAYLDGNLFASGEGSQLWSHSGDITIGGVGDTLFPDGGSGAAAFLGLIDDFRIYNRALSPHDVAVLSGQYNEGAAITLATTWRDDLTAFYNLPEAVETVLHNDGTAVSDTTTHPTAKTPSSAEADKPGGFTAPGVDETPEQATPETNAPPPPPPDTTVDTGANAADNADPSLDDTSTAHAEAEPSDDEEAPRVTEVPTDGKASPQETKPRHPNADPLPVPASSRAPRDD